MSDTITVLNRLIQLDIDASLAYTQAIENVDFPEISTRLTSFRSDHERHIEDLSAEIWRLGGEPIDRKRDLKGFFIENFTAIRSMTGTEGALKAMRMNEKLTNSTYEAALKSDLVESTRAIVTKNRADELRHLNYIERVLTERFWEPPQKEAV